MDDEEGVVKRMQPTLVGKTSPFYSAKKQGKTVSENQQMYIEIDQAYYEKCRGKCSRGTRTFKQSIPSTMVYTNYDCDHTHDFIWQKNIVTSNAFILINATDGDTISIINLCLTRTHAHFKTPLLHNNK